MPRARRLPAWLLLLLPLHLSAAPAVHGFLSQALLHTSDNRLFGDSDDGVSADYTELGLNASLQPAPRLQLAGQVLLRRAGEGHENDLELDYALLDWRVRDALADAVGIRLGRLKNPIGFYNATRDVAFTRPGILLPESIYYDRSRQLLLASDGLALYWDATTDHGEWSSELVWGWPQVGDEGLERSFLGQDWPGALRARPSAAARVLYAPDGGRLRLGLSAVHLAIDYDPASSPPQDLDPGDVQVDYAILSAEYTSERWTVTAEYARRPNRYRGLYDDALAPLPAREFESESAYLQAVYRIAPDWRLMLRRDQLYLDRDDRDGTKFAAHSAAFQAKRAALFGGAPGPAVPAHTRFAEDWTIGLAWDLSPALLLMAEYHRVHGTAWLPLQDNPQPQAQKEDWELLALMVSYRF